MIISVKKSVSAPERKSNESPRFVELLQGKNASDGDPVSLQCRIAGKPDTVEWLRDGKVVKSSDDFRYENSGDKYKLVIPEIFPEDSGVYTCHASSAQGSAESSCSLFVTVPEEAPTGPIFSTFPQAQSIDEGSSVCFNATLDSPSTVTVSWSKDGRPIEDSGRFKLSQDGNRSSFSIPAALSTDTGSYTLTAADNRGKASCTFSLAVRMGDGAGDVDVQKLIESVQ